jgi:hypothetical protein
MTPNRTSECEPTGTLELAYYNEGIKAGKRLAKGKTQFANPRGHPRMLSHGILVLQFIDFVNGQMTTGISLGAAVSIYHKLLYGSDLWSFSPSFRLTSEQLQTLYKRATKPKSKVISDDDRRIYDISKTIDLPNT